MENLRRHIKSRFAAADTTTTGFNNRYFLKGAFRRKANRYESKGIISPLGQLNFLLPFLNIKKLETTYDLSVGKLHRKLLKIKANSGNEAAYWKETFSADELLHYVKEVLKNMDFKKSKFITSPERNNFQH